MKPKVLKQYFVQYRKRTNRGMGKIHKSKWFTESGAEKFAMSVLNDAPLIYIVKVDENNPTKQTFYKFVDTHGKIQLWTDYYKYGQSLPQQEHKVDRRLYTYR